MSERKQFTGGQLGRWQVESTQVSTVPEWLRGVTKRPSVKSNEPLPHGTPDFVYGLMGKPLPTKDASGNAEDK